MVELPKGGNAPVVGTVVRSVLHTQLAPGEIDICALLLDAQRRTRCDEDFVYFNQERSACGSTRRPSPIEVEVDLRRVPATVDAIVIAASLDEGAPGHIAGHGGGEIHVHDNGTTITHRLTGLTTERCVILTELYRRAGGWKLRAVSQGYDDLAGLIASFGVEANEPRPDRTERGHPQPTPAPSQPPVLQGRTPVRDDAEATSPQVEGAALKNVPVVLGQEAVPAETREVIERVRLGVAARRATSASPLHPQASRSAGRRRDSMTVTQYRAQRRQEADMATADMRQQIGRLESILREIPTHRDLGVKPFLELVDASVPTPASPRWRIFGRREQAPLPAPPSVTLGPAIHHLLHLAGALSNREAVEAWMWLATLAMDLQPSFGHTEHISVQPGGRKIVLDIAAPDRDLVPADAHVRYRVNIDYLEPIPMAVKERQRLTNVLFGAAVVAHANTLARALRTAQLPEDLLIIVNCWEWARDPATGSAQQVCRGTLPTSAQQLATIGLGGVEPLACVRGLGGRIDEAGHVTPRGTRAGSSASDGRDVDLATIDPIEFERLVTELAEAMGYVAYRTPRSGDHGVDVFVESTDTLASGRIVISVKRYHNTVGPDHVRALDGVVRDQGAIKGILITTSGFGPESYRFVQGKPLQLVDGGQLRQWLHTYLGVSAR